MQKVNFNFCCGTVEIGSFGWDADLNAHQLNNLLQEARTANKGFAIATTVASQKGATKLLRTTGWKVLRRFQNPNTGAHVTMWGRSTTV